MKYFCLALLSLFLYSASFAISPITGSPKVCTGTTTQLSNATPGGTWSSSAVYIATVGSAGQVTGVAVGTTIITYNAGGVLATVTVSVNPISAVIGNTTVCAGLTTKLSDATLGGIWSSGNALLATVGTTLGIATVTTVAPGTDTIFYTMPSGCVANTVLTINPLPAPITGITNVCVLQTTTLTDATYNGNWSSSIPATAKVGGISGIVLGQAAGIAIITYTIPTGCIMTTSVTVNPLPAPITGSAEAYHGNSSTLNDATLLGTWSINNTSIATVSPAGVVTGIKAGDVYVYYTLPATGCYVSRKFLVDPLPDSGVVFPITAWYPFCADTTDHSGNKQDLTIHNPKIGPNAPTPPTLTTDRFNYTNAAYQFNGTSLMRYTPDFTTSTVSGDFTYSCWIKFNPIPQSSVIIYNGNPNLDGFGFIMNGGLLGTPGNRIGVLVYGSGLFLPTTVSGTGWAGTGWHQLVLVKNSNLFFLYVDNTPQGNFPATSIITPTGDFSVGNDFTGSASIAGGFIGDIDDVGVFNYALDSLQLVDLYNFNPDQPAFTLGKDTTICAASIQLTPVPQTQGSYYIWSTADSVDTSIVVTPALKGTTPYSLSITRPYACTAFAQINISKRPLDINLGVDTNMCLGDTIVLHSIYPFATYLWNTGDTTNFLKVFGTGTFWVTVDSGVCMGTDTVNITGWRKPLVDLGPDVSNCTGASFEVHNSYPDIKYDNGYTYLWSNGSSNDSLLTSTSGTFWLEVSNHGCAQTDTMNVHIVFDTFSFHTRDTSICRGRFVTASATFNPIVSYQWTPTTGIPLSTVPSPNITPDTSATYYLRGTYPGCPDIVDSFRIDVQPYPIVNIGGNRQVCTFDTLHIKPLVTPNWYTKYNYKWSPGAFLDDSTAQNVVFLAGDSTDLTLTVTTSAGCTGSDSLLVSVHPGGFDSTILNYNVCPGDSVQLSTFRRTVGLTVGTIASYEWHPGILLNDSMAASPWLHPVTTSDYTVIGTSSFGCKDTLSFDVVVNPGAVIYLGDSVILHPGQTDHISPQTNCVYFHWFPSYGISDTSIADPVVSPGLNTRYIVHATTEFGCNVVDSIDVHVDYSTLLAIPNAFTPGGNVDNILYIIKNGIATLNYFRIFDRWGVKVFEATNIENGWDGTYKGAPEPFGVYVYEAEATTSTGQVFHQQGNITLIR